MFEFSLEIPEINAMNWWNKSKNDLTRLVEKENRNNWPKERDIETQERWAPRRPPTGNWPILRKSGTMFDTAKFSPGIVPLTFVVTTTNYGPFHQEGTDTMPQRRWLGVPDELAPEVERVLIKHLFPKGVKRKYEFRGY